MTSLRCDGATEFSMTCALLDLRSSRKNDSEVNPRSAFDGGFKRNENFSVSAEENLSKQALKKIL